ncbi:MAG TPA: hypothetical protein VFN94_02970, partial [Nitrospiria bacterium]|nr:hypothetical protein [Nitrospiria bacterium]
TRISLLGPAIRLSTLTCVENTGQLWQAAEKAHLLRSRSSELLTYDPVRSGFLLPAALRLELFEQPASFSVFGLTTHYRTIV